MTADLSAFILARIDEDEQDARQTQVDIDRWRRETEVNGPDGSQGSIVVSGILGNASDPARVLAQCAAIRAVVALHSRAVWHQPAGAFIQSLGRRLVEEGDHLGGCSICAGDNSEAEWPCPTLRALASVYADHPDYRPEEWA